MDKKLQDHAWSILPKEFKEEVKRMYRIADSDIVQMIATIILENVFGYDNLASDAEEEEMLMVSRDRVIQNYKEKVAWKGHHQSSKHDRDMATGWCNALRFLFGSKCLPDETNLSESLTGSEPKQAEPTNEGTRQEQCVPKSAESGTRSCDNILKDGFRDHNRLHIAAMMAQGLLSNGNGFCFNNKNVDKNPENVAEAAFIFAEALIAECEKGGDK